MTYTRWGNEQKEELRRLWGTNLSTRQIGMRMGFPKSAISGQAFRMDLPRKHEWGKGKLKLARASPEPIQPSLEAVQAERGGMLVSLPRVRWMEKKIP